MFFNQAEFPIRCEWGLEAVTRFASTSDVFVIVDVISFSTTVDIAVSRGGRVYPYRGPSEQAAGFAAAHNAILANGSRKDPSVFSLASSSMLRLTPGTSLVLPSLNGSTLSLSTGDIPTFAGCLRNASAVASACLSTGRRISVIPAGERWKDGSLRPSLEDWLGAGAILHAIQRANPQPVQFSPEAEAAAAAFLHFRGKLFETLAATGSGKEAADMGSSEDIRLAADCDASAAVPLLVDGAYQART